MPDVLISCYTDASSLATTMVYTTNISKIVWERKYWVEPTRPSTLTGVKPPSIVEVDVGTTIFRRFLSVAWQRRMWSRDSRSIPRTSQSGRGSKEISQTVDNGCRSWQLPVVRPVMKWWVIVLTEREGLWPVKGKLGFKPLSFLTCSTVLPQRYTPISFAYDGYVRSRCIADDSEALPSFAKAY